MDMRKLFFLSFLNNCAMSVEQSNFWLKKSISVWRQTSCCVRKSCSVIGSSITGSCLELHTHCLMTKLFIERELRESGYLEGERLVFVLNRFDIQKVTLKLRAHCKQIKSSTNAVITRGSFLKKKIMKNVFR